MFITEMLRLGRGYISEILKSNLWHLKNRSRAHVNYVDERKKMKNQMNNVEREILHSTIH